MSLLVCYTKRSKRSDIMGVTQSMKTLTGHKEIQIQLIGSVCLIKLCSYPHRETLCLSAFWFGFPSASVWKSASLNNYRKMHINTTFPSDSTTLQQPVWLLLVLFVMFMFGYRGWDSCRKSIYAKCPCCLFVRGWSVFAVYRPFYKRSHMSEEDRGERAEDGWENRNKVTSVCCPR